MKCPQKWCLEAIGSDVYPELEVAKVAGFSAEIATLNS